MSDVTLTMPVTRAMQLQAAAEDRLARLNTAAASGRLDPFGVAVNTIARAELEAALDDIRGALYPAEPDVVAIWPDDEMIVVVTA